MEHESEHLLSTSLASLSKGRQKLAAHIGLWVAFLSLLVAALVTFTDVSLLSLSAQTLSLTVAVYAAVTVVMYLSLEEEGERVARAETAYKEAEKALSETVARVTPELYGELEAFCRRYTKYTAAAAHIQNTLAFNVYVLQSSKAKGGGLVLTCAE